MELENQCKSVKWYLSTTKVKKKKIVSVRQSKADARALAQRLRGLDGSTAANNKNVIMASIIGSS